VEITETNALTNLAVGGCLFSIGLFKKAVIADSLVQFVLPTFDPPEWFSGRPVTLLIAWAGVLTYTFQLYFDFSGYSDMALGVARIFGVRLPANFNSPFKASSIVEYWNRWHITLTRFLTSYIYTPIVLHLTRTRVAKGRPVLRGKRSSLPAIAVLVAVPALITMTTSGIWHGAGWQFIVWGLLHGVYITINQTWRMLRPRFWSDEAHYERIMKPIGLVLTFGCVVAALVFFRASSVSSALSILGGMIGMHGILPYDVQLLQRLGVHMPWNIVMLFQPIAPFVWAIALFLAVTLLPNSLELMRRFQPALEFPVEALTRPARLPVAVRKLAGTGAASVITRLRAAWTGVVRIGREGVSLSSIAAAIIALVCVLGILAVNGGGVFLYGQF
jgi:D-alanyl-lipoteichoic acid acyltransferase DltB (MBOAT superfamily)